MPVFDSLSIVLGAFFVCALVFAIVRTCNVMSKEKNEKDLKQKNIDDTFDKPEQPDIDILKWMKFNMKEINDFIIMSKYQTKKAFTIAVISFFYGLLLFGAAVIRAIQAPPSADVICLSICGAITEFLCYGSMAIYNKAQDQLNNYFRSLHENERFLSAVKIVEYITRENRDNAIEGIIQKQMSGSQEKQS